MESNLSVRSLKRFLRKNIFIVGVVCKRLGRRTSQVETEDVQIVSSLHARTLIEGTRVPLTLAHTEYSDAAIVPPHTNTK